MTVINMFSHGRPLGVEHVSVRVTVHSVWFGSVQYWIWVWSVYTKCQVFFFVKMHRSFIYHARAVGQPRSFRSMGSKTRSLSTPSQHTPRMAIMNRVVMARNQIQSEESRVMSVDAPDAVHVLFSHHPAHECGSHSMKTINHDTLALVVWARMNGPHPAK